MAQRGRARGFTLIEMLISMVIALVVMTGIVSVFVSSSDSYRRLQGLASIQERGRIAIQILQNSVQVAGYNGCRKNVTINNVLNSNTDYTRSFIQPIEGFDATTTANTWDPAMVASSFIPSPLWAGGDVLTVRGPIGSGVNLTADMANTSDTLSVPAGSPFVANDWMMAVSCAGNADVFEKTNAAGTTIAHTASGLNSSASLGSVYEANAVVVKVAPTSFFIRDSSAIANTRALWLKEGDDAAQALIEGVDGMQVLYGVTSNTDTSANQYLTAAQVDAGALWGRVVNVRISLLVATLNPTVKTPESTVYSLLGENYGPFSDLRQRRVFTTTITLRNRSF
ncbi:MAG: PilW family protein [Mariprofundaceae bacterium]|nr:PilW family protein [Mariprofundaceae bacterium]